MTISFMFDNIIRRTIVATILLLLAYSAVAQVTITGYVYDENRNPIIGASVIEKNGSATMTDVKGWFKIEVSERKPLTVTFIGCKLLEINEKENDQPENRYCGAVGGRGGDFCGAGALFHVNSIRVRRCASLFDNLDRGAAGSNRRSA